MVSRTNENHKRRHDDHEIMSSSEITFALCKEQRFGSFQDAVALIQTFALNAQQRRVHVQPEQPIVGGDEGVDDEGERLSKGNVVVVECENAPDCKWYVRLTFVKSEQKWKMSSMNLAHHKTQCVNQTTDVAITANVDEPTASNPTSTLASFQRMMREDISMDLVNPTVVATATTIGHLHIGTAFVSWKEAIASVRVLAHQMGRRAVAEKSSELVVDGRTVTVRRVVCQNHRNSNCEWMVVLEGNNAGGDGYSVLSMHLLHSKECCETCNFSARKKEPVMVTAQANTEIDSKNTSLTLAEDTSKYQLTHEMRWSTGKEATKAISDFTLVVQRKRSKLCKKNNGGSNKKYVCSDEQCLWFVQLVKGWKSKNWKISAMNLKHSDNCTGEAKPTARQLAEMRFFRQAVITHSKSNGKLLTDNFLVNQESGIRIPRGMAYRAQRLVVATSTDDLTESYKFIPSLLDAFAKKNPGSTVKYEKDEAGHFLRAFIMPNAMSMSLLGLQQVLGIQVLNYDSVSYTGNVVLLIGRDGNFQSQVLAFAMLPNCEMDQMVWFLALTKVGGVRYENGYPIFCAHNQNGLLRAIAHEARNAKIMFCVRNLLEEMQRDKNIPDLLALEELVWDMQAQETEEGFMKVLSQLESLNAPAAAFIRALHPKNWAYHLNRSIRLFKWNNTSIDEALLGSDLRTSDEAPFDMMYGFLAFLMDNVYKKNQLAQKLVSENPLLTPGADAIYRHELEESASYTVRFCDEQVAFTWRTGERPKVTHRVDLAMRTCTCGQIHQLGIPCRHFIAVTVHFANEVTLIDAFDPIYKAATYVEICRTLRIEIPAAGDLSKDVTILPAASLKLSKQKKRQRPVSSSTSDGDKSIMNMGMSMAISDEGLNTSSMGMPMSMALPISMTIKVPRLEFDADVVSGLTELV